MLAVALDVTDTAIRIGLQPEHDKSGAIVADRETGRSRSTAMRWTGRRPRGLVKPGDVVYVEPVDGQRGEYRLRQIPEVSGACVAMDPFTGRVLAMVGGFSFDQSEFNRATQAQRQPGSSFKPFVYAAALDNGYTPSSIVLDEPIAIDRATAKIWTPENFEGKSGGPHTLRFGVEHSINQMTVRLARDIGMPLIVEYAKRFGIYDNLPPFLSMSLGAGETTVAAHDHRPIRCSPTAASAIKATLIDRIQDRWGNTIYQHDERICEGCDAPKWDNQDEPKLVDKREQVIDPLTAYQITSIMEGVIQRGTGIAIKEVGKHLAGKTGTTNDAKDLWFVGYSPNLAFGVFMGYDKPRSLGDSAQAALYTAPIFRDFMKMALKDTPDTPFRVPPGIKLISVDVHYRACARPGPGTIMEAFKPGTAPPDTYNGGGGGGEAAQASARSESEHRSDRGPAGSIRQRRTATPRPTRRGRFESPDQLRQRISRLAHARRSRTTGRDDQAVHRTAEEASLTSSRDAASSRTERQIRRSQSLERSGGRAEASCASGRCSRTGSARSPKSERDLDDASDARRAWRG